MNPPPPPAHPPAHPPHNKSRRRIWRRLKLLFLAPLEYFWNFRWKKHLDHAEFFGSVWHSGWVGRWILLALLGLALLAPFAIPLANLALQVSSYGYVIETGAVIIQGPAEELRSNPEVRAAYLGHGG